ncbi:MAG TPA: ABC transporter ATP-binding protein [Pirellulaceae bacterium]
MYRLQNVVKVYRKRHDEITAFRAEDLRIQKGEYVAIVGPSGSGKTTLLSILGGMLAPDQGQVWLDDAVIYDLSASQRARLRSHRMGFVFQTFNLVPYLTAQENVQVALYLAGAPKAEHSWRSAALLEQVGLGQRRDHKPCELSTGQQQRVALARTLANDPGLILADEPTGNLDPESREQVLSLFDEFVRQGRTVVMVTHDPAAARRAARRIMLRDGSVVPEIDAPRRAVA